ncbi:tRNA (adenosine(37)-N6)-dimethylallyltransferase MiaA [Acetobacter sp. LMG 1636]|uniref:tRNA dimethylallyltransferase n=2 Tax=Acetobacter fallax TaxID=1737473 RepID=A0ABX0KBW6_9PROT|nr:tRNA (adenosine(37)-N6)-dimethylallyltransferase MiaA [Acetobacter fallax]NHO31995.1 tRNA (adenosine(37)-N6)-dimethylallyltransferase MiaA [Acetobacter fallax]NHO35489.1 tRNA (adenosine(37)-N6)-dimethylallyltransferase MiaA [Acetobacter fallax]
MNRGQAGRIALIVAGPTCSGKSALALALGSRLGGTVINADSMQVYRELRILTARPTPEEEALLPHRLYGISPAVEARSVAWWRLEALAAMEEAWNAGRLPILCGGTGMYLRALTDGLAEVPDPGAEARTEARAFSVDPERLHARLMEVDPETGSGLSPTDTQRLARAWEVWRGTGHGLAWWRAQPGLPAAPCRFVAVRLAPDRAELREAIAARFGAMVERGAVEEVRALLDHGLDPALPAMRAHGVPELAAMLRGDISLAEAKERAVLATGRYTKRQATWFGHHSLAADGDAVIYEKRIVCSEQYMERKYGKIISFVHERIDAGRSGA